MTSILDQLPYPWVDPAAQELHAALTRLYPTPAGATIVAQRAGIDVGFLDAQQPPVYVWHDILELAAQRGITRDVVRTVRDLLAESSPSRPLLDDLLAGRPARLPGEMRNPDGSARFLRHDDRISELEALLFRDDLTLEIGRVPALIATLTRLLELAPAVCRLVVNVQGSGLIYGSGFRIASDMLLTNWHVLHLADGTPATAVTAEFGYEDDGHGGCLPATEIPCDVASIRSDRTDDWAVIQARVPLQDHWPIVKLSEAAEPVRNAPAYIIQHPGGNRKRLGYVRNQVSSFDDLVVYYLTDTEPGSSGSPVFNARGQLIALHHAAGSPQTVVGRPPMSKNEGIRIQRVVGGLKAQSIAVT
jgi:V8-like Glu-specific endopeptidase